MMRQATSTIAALVLALGMASAAAAAPPDVPAQLSYQGVLLDDLGDPLTGPIDLDVRIYDQAAGGTLLYKEGFSNTPLSAGTFSLVIGATGDASDVPTNPLTTSLADVFTGDLVSGPGRFLELTVGGDPALARVQVLSAPLALRAESAGHADTADSATSADTVVSVDGTDPSVLTQIFTHFNFDDSNGPPATDPREGIGDVDGDGIANFMDPDNDNDGITDGSEVSNGTDMNLATPSNINGSVSGTAGGTAGVGGQGFEAGLSVLLDGQPVTPFNVTNSSFQFTIAPHAIETIPIQVTNLNGETGSGNFTFTFVTPNSFNHTVSPMRVSTFDVKLTRTVILGIGTSDYRVDTNDSTNPNLQVPVPAAGEATFGWNTAGLTEGMKCVASGSDCTLLHVRDTNGDFAPELELPVETVSSTTASSLLSADIDFDAGGTAVMAYVRGHDGTSADVVVARDANGNSDWSDLGDVIVLEAGANDGSVRVTLDSTGRAAVLYHLDSGGPGSLRLAYDLSGDGDFDDANELQTVLAGDVDCFDVTTDGNDRLAILFQSSAGGGLTLIQDLDGDADLGDVGETSTLGTSSANACAIERSAGGGLAQLDNAGGTVKLRVDRDFDDTLDPAELPIETSSGSQLGLKVGDTGKILVVTEFSFYLDLD